MLPLPGDLQPLHVRGVDVGERRVLRAGLIAAVVEPLDLAGGLALCAGKRRRKYQK